MAGRKSLLALWTLAIAAGLLSVRYFLRPVPLLEPAQQLALARHPALLLIHIGSGTIALVLGPVQFISRFRRFRPNAHRWLGRLYLTAVCIGGAVGLWLSPDTRLFLAEGLSDGYRIYEKWGIDPMRLGLTESSIFAPGQFTWAMWGFIALSICWLITGAMAFLRAIQHRISAHQMWTRRNYALTFAAVTVRVLALPLLLLTRRPVLASALTFWSWTLNLIVAEFLRMSPKPAAEEAQAAVAV